MEYNSIKTDIMVILDCIALLPGIEFYECRHNLTMLLNGEWEKPCVQCKNLYKYKLQLRQQIIDMRAPLTALEAFDRAMVFFCDFAEVQGQRAAG